MYLTFHEKQPLRINIQASTNMTFVKLREKHRIGIKGNISQIQYSMCMNIITCSVSSGRDGGFSTQVSKCTRECMNSVVTGSRSPFLDVSPHFQIMQCH